MGAATYRDPALDRPDQCRQQANQMLDPAGRRTFSQQALLRLEVGFDASGDVERESLHDVRQRPILGKAVAELAQSGEVAQRELAQGLDLLGSRLAVLLVVEG